MKDTPSRHDLRRFPQDSAGLHARSTRHHCLRSISRTGREADFAYPTLVLNLLPVGLVGLVMAALLAAVMGAMSSVFNSASTLVTLDFYKKLRPQASENNW